MKPLVLEFIGGHWDGRILRTDSSDYEEQLLAAACYEMSHHGAVGGGCVGLANDAGSFARRHGWAVADDAVSWEGDRYSVAEHRETETEIILTVCQRRHAMSALDQPKMHEEHHDAECEHVMWLEDIGRWRSEHRRAVAMLAQAQAALLEHEAALESHAENVRGHELHVQRHERALAAQQRAANAASRDVLEDSHLELQNKHDQAREAHQRIKEHHHVVTAEIRRLSEKLSASM